jgi:major type 1 subunit fimbrin (pilin)
MNILNAKKYLLTLGLALVGSGAMAQTATISFSGIVLSQTCVITAGNSPGVNTATSSLSVPLPTVSSGQLSAAGNVVGKTVFYMGVASCAAAASGVTYTPKLYLSSSNINSGYLGTGVANLVLELFDKDNNSLTLSTTPTVYSGSSFSYTQGGAVNYENAFYIQYRAITGAAAAGSPSATMNVLLQYS